MERVDSSGLHQLEYKGYLKGRFDIMFTRTIAHGGWVTSMQVGEITEGDTTKEFLVSGSRDKTVMIWDIVERNDTDPDKEWGVPKKVLKGNFCVLIDLQAILISSATWLFLRIADIA